MKAYLLHQEMAEPIPNSQWRNLELCVRFIFMEKNYNINTPEDAIKLDHVVVIGSLLINQTREKKLPLETKFIQVSCHVMHHLMKHVLLPRKENCDDLLKEGVLPLRLLT